MDAPDARPLPPVGAPSHGAVEVGDPRLLARIDADAPLARLADGCAWAEGPVWLPGEGVLEFSDIPNDRALRWSPRAGLIVWREPNDFTNGNTLDHEGRVVHCEHGTRRVTRTEPDGRRLVLADRYRGGRLNSPNDVVVASDGSIWFTDPPYGILSDHEGHRADSEQAGCFVFRLDPDTGELTVVVDSMGHPNGLAFSPDERTLYVADTLAATVEPTADRHILAFDVVEGIRCERPRAFAMIDPGVADGLRVDIAGNVWTSAWDGIHVIDPDGTELGRIRVPEKTSNCVFGGTAGTTLFITASTSLYAIEVRVHGAGVAAAVARGERLARRAGAAG
jgi:gluconolactonase